MKTNEMEDICKSHLGHCKECELNVIEDWEIKLTTWCLLEYRLHTIRNYIKAMKDENVLLAQQIENNYKDVERRYLHNERNSPSIDDHSNSNL